MKIKGARAIVTGAGRGLGKAIATTLLERGAAHVYPAARDIDRLRSVYADEPRATVIELDVTNLAAVARAAEIAADVDIVVNNAAVIHHDPVLAATALDNAREEMEVNYWGLVNMCRAFAPLLAVPRPTALVNVLSVGSLASIPVSGTYGATKAAAWSATQCIRAELAGTDTLVLATFPGPIDTEMSDAKDRTGRHSPILLANNILDALEADEDHLYPDPTSAEWGATFDRSPRSIETLFANFIRRPE